MAEIPRPFTKNQPSYQILKIALVDQNSTSRPNTRCQNKKPPTEEMGRMFFQGLQAKIGLGQKYLTVSSHGVDGLGHGHSSGKLLYMYTID